MKKMYNEPQTEVLLVAASGQVMSGSPLKPDNLPVQPGTIAPAPAKASADSVQVY